MWKLELPKRLIPYAKLEVEVEKNDKILYIAFKLQIKIFHVDFIIVRS